MTTSKKTAPDFTASARKTSRGFVPQITVFGKVFEYACVPKKTEELALKECAWELKQVAKLENKRGSFVSTSWTRVGECLQG